MRTFFFAHNMSCLVLFILERKLNFSDCFKLSYTSNIFMRRLHTRLHLSKLYSQTHKLKNWEAFKPWVIMKILNLIQIYNKTVCLIHLDVCVSGLSCWIDKKIRVYKLFSKDKLCIKIILNVVLNLTKIKNDQIMDGAQFPKATAVKHHPLSKSTVTRIC